jgi:drug/metabolite transporter (DMT)-like permease
VFIRGCLMFAMKIAFYTTFALVAFAFNSILCRLALRGDEIDPVGFTLVRLASGAAVLILLSYFFGGKSKQANEGNWISAFFLFAYAICFSLAYLNLSAGMGALILFGCVQLTMIGWSIAKGERPPPLEWIGLLAALGGLVYLVFPSLEAPPLWSSSLMAGAGIAWGAYTLRGKGSSDPLSDTTANFVRSVPMIAVVAIPFFQQIHSSSRGILLAVLSGAVASGVGYTAWYTALKGLTATRAAVLQLAVPVLAAAGGVWFLSEVATTRLWIAAALILGGIAIVIAARKR